MLTYDINVAKANIAAQIKAAEENLEQLRTSERLITEQGESVLLVVNALTKYGRAPREKAALANSAAVTIDKNTPTRHVVRAIINAAPAPLRAKDIERIAREQHHRDISAERAGQDAVILGNTGAIKRMGHGLYWRADAAHTNGAGPAPAPVVPTGKGEKGSAKRNHAALIAAIKDVLTHEKEPLKVSAIADRLIERGIAIGGDNYELKVATVKRAMGKLGKAVKLTGWARGAAYSLKTK